VRLVVIGAGAVGGLVAANLRRTGEQVVAVARGAHGNAIACDGLRLRTRDGEETVRLPVVADVSHLEFTSEDVVLLSVKSQATESTLEQLRTVAPLTTPIICLQNGVESERRALRLFDRVYSGLVFCYAVHLEPGRVDSHASPLHAIIDVGRYPGGVDVTAVAVSEALRRARIDSVARADILPWKYSKLALNLGNAAAAICHDDDALKELRKHLSLEGRRVLAAAGIDVIAEDEFDRRVAALGPPVLVAGEPFAGGSVWQSLARKSGSIEVDYLNGEIGLLARLHGASAPANALVQQLAAQHAAADLNPRQLTASALLAELGPD